MEVALRELIDKHLDWHSIKAKSGNELNYSIEKAVFSRETAVLTVEIKSNFDFPAESLVEIKKSIINQIAGLKDVAIHIRGEAREIGVSGEACSDGVSADESSTGNSKTDSSSAGNTSAFVARADAARTNYASADVARASNASADAARADNASADDTTSD